VDEKQRTVFKLYLFGNTRWFTRIRRENRNLRRKTIDHNCGIWSFPPERSTYIRRTDGQSKIFNFFPRSFEWMTFLFNSYSISNSNVFVLVCSESECFLGISVFRCLLVLLLWILHFILLIILYTFSCSRVFFFLFFLAMLLFYRHFCWFLKF
jgi:hypothetical protein